MAARDATLAAGKVPADLLERVLAAEAYIETAEFQHEHRFPSNCILASSVVRWGSYVREFYATENTVFLFAAVAAWPANEPVHSDIWVRVQRISGAIADAAEAVVNRKQGGRVDDANASILRAVGVVSGGGKGSNAIAVLRDQALARTLIEAREELRVGEPGLRAKEVIGRLAVTFKMTDANVRRILPARKRP